MDRSFLGFTVIYLALECCLEPSPFLGIGYLKQGGGQIILNILNCHS